MSNENSEYKKTTDLFLELEKNHDLLEWLINGVFAWQAARINIYSNVSDAIMPNNGKSVNISFLTKAKYFLKRVFINSLVYNPFFDFKKSEVLVFDSGRKYLVDKKYIDIYTDYLCSKLHHKNISYRKYATNYSVDELSKRTLSIKHIDFIYLSSKILSKFINVKFNEKDHLLINTIEKEIYLSLGIHIDLKHILKTEIKRFLSQKPHYKLLFKIKNPTDIFLINSTDKAALIKAAKECKIIVNELQHGLITKEGVVANFPYVSEDSLEYFPHKFYIWKDLDICTAKLPLSQKNIVYFKNEHLNHMIKRTKEITRNHFQILIVSQPNYSNKILEFLMSNIKELKDWKIIYKIHPMEDSSSFKDSKTYNFAKHENIIFIENNESIYRLFAESEYVLGVYSTAVFEASHFGCKVILLNLPGVEHLASLIKDGKAKLININESLSQIL